MSSADGTIRLDQQEVTKAIKGLTGIDFQLGEFDRYPIPKERVKAFFWPADPAVSRKVPYVYVLWIDVNNTIHIDTDRLGDTLDMIEWIYGSEWLRYLSRENLEGFGQKTEVWAKFSRDFPPVANRLLKYETAIAEISQKHSVPLEILYHGSQSLVSFRIEARIDPAQVASLSVERAVHLAIAALEEAFYKIRGYQKRLADAWGYLPGR